MARIEAIRTSKSKGTGKTMCLQADVRAGHGICGDSHAGGWHRRIRIPSRNRHMHGSGIQMLMEYENLFCLMDFYYLENEHGGSAEVLS